tara:strand:+ start:286 stop:429 length:144 start_codon:yes stop_codon:yes gene_type:complete
MDYKEEEKDKSSLEVENDTLQSDYKFLVKKLKTIKESINLLEKKLFR